ncbi:MAG: OmpH family outer membrane protein [Nitrospirae bacterium]|nr:MAG: OmpH family outer membrane protein [Nitrospirota bacterium]
MKVHQHLNSLWAICSRFFSRSAWGEAKHIVSQANLWLTSGYFLGLVVLVSCASSTRSADTTNPIAQQGIRVGVVDMQWLLAQSKLGKRVNQSLTSFMKDRQALIDLEQEELRELETQLLRQGSVLSPSARQRRQEQFRRRMLEYQQKVADLNREVQEKQAELFDEFREQVEAVVATIARQRGLIVVLEKGKTTPVRYYAPQLDISEEVLSALDRQSSEGE